MEKKYTVLKCVDTIINDVSQYASGFELKYNRAYIGLSKNGITSNFIFFRPKKNYVYLYSKCEETPERSDTLDNTDLEWIYSTRSRGYRIKINKVEEYKNNRLVIESLIHNAMEYRNIEV